MKNEGKGIKVGQKKQFMNMRLHKLDKRENKFEYFHKIINIFKKIFLNHSLNSMN